MPVMASVTPTVTARTAQSAFRMCVQMLPVASATMTATAARANAFLINARLHRMASATAAATAAAAAAVPTSAQDNHGLSISVDYRR